MDEGQARVLAALDDVALRLEDPRRWVQGTFEGIRRGSNVKPFWQYVDKAKSNCWCVTSAVTMATSKALLVDAPLDTWCALRAEVERELLSTIEATTGVRWPCLYRWNDAPTTAHGDVLACLAATSARLKSAPRV